MTKNYDEVVWKTIPVSDLVFITSPWGILEYREGKWLDQAGVERTVEFTEGGVIIYTVDDLK